ncbi:MAG: hypothetical protein JRI23_09565, partial [Deltaproteobacteria bacterium]|nr:hypothetical protein [Deltaproteobacteria bacterium]MBW2531897.1 hypothetical protein [Deltaproteobacteria bacterium]
MSARTKTFAWAIAVAAMVPLGCSDDEDGGSGGQGPTCGTMDSPQTVVLADVQPAAGSSVPNQDIVHAFTVIDSPGTFESFTFVLGMLHTAGSPVSGGFQFTITQEGANHRYVAQPIAWSDAPGNVHMVVQERYEAADGCFYALPAPLFEYGVTAGTAGSGGTGGTGGT